GGVADDTTLDEHILGEYRVDAVGAVAGLGAAIPGHRQVDQFDAVAILHLDAVADSVFDGEIGRAEVVDAVDIDAVSAVGLRLKVQDGAVLALAADLDVGELR